uniref:Reverse transcriptase family protein n=1 Tax=Chlorobium chlorochromatii (strain CaD3) TaxID=340177 RepID=Q3APX9_CHLCH
MKRKGKLVEQIADLHNLYEAFYKAQKGKQAKRYVCAYRKQLQENLQLLRHQILSGAIQTGKYHAFTIYDPKERVICATPFSQRVLHHAIMNVCHPFFEKHQIAGSFASRKGKGTYAALDKAREYNCCYRWFLKLDVRKYFDSINHTVLQKQLTRLFKDKTLLLIFEQIIDSYSTADHKGVPIGNLTSQYFANHYLSVADHYAKEGLRVPAYVRYMDDMVLWHNEKEELLAMGYMFQTFIAKELLLELKPFCLNATHKGLPFLGYLLFENQARLAPRSKKRFLAKYQRYENNLQSGVWTQQEFAKHALPLFAFTEYAQAREFRKKSLHSFCSLEGVFVRSSKGID